MIGRGKVGIIFSFPVYLIILFLFSLILPVCKDWNPNASDPKQPEVKYYTYEIKYERPTGSIANNEGPDPGDVNLEVHEKDGSIHAHSPRLTKLSDYSFIATSREIAPESLVKIYLCDPKRWKEKTEGPGLIYGNPHTVGDIFTLKCVQTGFQ